MGFQVTILLALVVYIDILQNLVPVWMDYNGVPRAIWLFIISIIVVSIGCLETCLSLSMHMVGDEQLFNYGRRFASITRFTALCFNYMSFNQYPYKIPIVILQLSGASPKQIKPENNDELSRDLVNLSDEEDENVQEELRKAWRFTAKMMDLVHFVVSSVCMFATFCVTIVWLFVNS